MSDEAHKAATTPTLLPVKSFVIHCYACKRWVGRVPQWDNGELGHGWQCEHCGNTSTIMREGRPYGPRYRHWQVLVGEFKGFAEVGMLEGLSRKWILETVEVAQ